MTLDALLTSCNAIVHINSKPTDTTFGGTTEKHAECGSNQDMLDAVDRPGNCTNHRRYSRIHPQWEPEGPYYGYDSSLPYTVAGNCGWKMALEQRKPKPVSIIRASNVQEFYSMVQKPMAYSIDGLWNV